MKTDFLKALEFLPKNNSINIYEKKYSHFEDYVIEVDLDKKSIDFGKSIFFNDSKKSVQNITKNEDLVVLECVNRLLTQGYNPKNIVLEKVYPSGHGTSGRLDILVTKEDGTAYMMIECKTWGKEYDKAFLKLQKDGGQLFTYFQQDKDAEILVLYASTFHNSEINYLNQIVKIEEEYKSTGNVKDFYDRWNKNPKNNGVFDSWTKPYNFQSKALTPKELVDIKQEDSSFIFNRFMEILRHNVVSDKPNAFNKIFTLFLCKIMDEKSTKPNQELEFQWLEGVDDDVTFQKRLTDLYQRGMKEFLDKEVTDLSDREFEEKFGVLDSSIKDKLLEEFTKIRLQKNNEFAIKDVFDQETFDENAIVVKEIVELLQGFKIRYTKKQQFLSDFFELLLTTGLKQEVGQFFTPVPIAKFIIKSIPFDKIINSKLKKGERNELLPNVIDYAVGSGHFITEAMDEIQKYILTCDTSDFVEDTANEVEAWKIKHFNWAYDYIYGIEKDYRLVKTAKVGCYLHGDGLAKVIHGDGLANFTQTKNYKGKLVKKDKNYPQDNKQFDVVISNPPYSVSSFKNVSKSFNGDDFELYEKLTDQSSEIEALFIERTKQLLKDGGIAGVILPSSILSNSGIYTKTREIIFKYFDIISITQLGSNTFMATGTNTVVLFLRRKNNGVHKTIENSIEKLFETQVNITINGIENPLSRYISHVWEDISVEDYFTLVDEKPNEKIQNHELYQEYDKKLNSIDKILNLEKEKLFYFLNAYKQKVTLVKTGEKKVEKKFLGYEFSARRGREGIHPTQRAKSIDECTSLYDEGSYENSLKVNSYIYSAFEGEYKEIDESLRENISYVDLVDMMSFDRVDFEKNISLSVKKKVKIESKWKLVKLGEKIELFDNQRIPLSQRERINGNYPYYGATGIIDYVDNYIFDEQLILIGEDGAKWSANENSSFIVRGKYWVNNHVHVFKPKREELLDKYLVEILNKYDLSEYITGLNVPKLNQGNLKEILIPLPPKKIQEKIVQEIEALEKEEKKVIEVIESANDEINKLVDNISADLVKLSEITTKIGSGATPRGGESSYKASGITLIRSQNVYDNSFVKKGLVYIDEEQARKLDNVRVQENDILFNITGASVARCCIVEKYYLPARVNQHVSIIRTEKKASSKYVQMILISSIYKAKLLEIGDGGTSREAITKSQLEEFKIPLPTPKEQKIVVDKIELIEEKILKNKEKLENIPKQKEEILDRYLK